MLSEARTKADFGDVQRLGGGDLHVSVEGVTPQFFQVYRVNAIAGRVFDPSLDREEHPTGVVINATAAHAIGFASPEAAVGHFLTLKEGAKQTAVRILGVSPDILHRSLRAPPEPVIYALDAGIYGMQFGTGILTMRAHGDPDATQHAIEALWPHYFPKDALLIAAVQDLH